MAGVSLSPPGTETRTCRFQACGTDGRPFVWHFAGFHDPAQASEEISCNARVGAEGCAIAQPLEAALKSLVPPDLPAVKPELQRLKFSGSDGHGTGANRGFLRADPVRGASLLLVVIITDKDDCSLAESALDVSEAAAACAGGASLHAVQRYVSAFRALSELVSFVIIAGLPPDLELTDDLDLTLESGASREAYYERVLSDPRLASPAASPSCESASASAHAPRRLIEFARAMRADASVYSICRDEFRRALYYRLNQVIQYQIGPPCIAWKSEFGATPKCRMTWELPLESDPEQPLTPARCSDRPEFLSAPSPGFPRRSEAGRTLCEVRKLEVTAADGGDEPVAGDGFYLDPAPSRGCRNRGTAELAWTPAARPPHGVAVRLTCNESVCDGHR